MPDSISRMHDVQQEVVDKLRARDRALATPTKEALRPETMLVRAADSEIPVKLLDGTLIQNEPVSVLKSDVFIARRIRDGSLVIVDPSTVKTSEEHSPSQPPSAPLDLGRKKN